MVNYTKDHSHWAVWYNKLSILANRLLHYTKDFHHETVWYITLQTLATRLYHTLH